MVMEATMQYEHNWVYECMATVYFKDGRPEQQAPAQTTDNGELEWVKLGGVYFYIGTRSFDLLGVSEIHFVTPAKLIV